MKFFIFLAFTLYSLYCFRHRPIVLKSKYRSLSNLTAYTILLLFALVLLRMASEPGALGDTALCMIQFTPWIISVFLIPLVFDPEHSLRDTLAAFESVAFWIVCPFWLMTVTLVVLGIRYPALSYPGALVRFGGILDDPNGYACLCLLLLALSLTVGRGFRRLKAAIYGLMLVGTLSFSGYITGVVMCLYLLPRWLARSRLKPRWNVLKVAAGCAVAFSLIAIPLTVYETNRALIETASLLYSGKTASAATHLSNLRPDDAMLDVSSPIALLSGSGGFSENFYWRILANFGWIGLFAVGGITVAWTYYALRVKQWNKSIGAWLVGVLVGSNGIAYLLNFPLNLIYWSVIALLLWTEERELRYVRAAPVKLAVA